MSKKLIGLTLALALFMVAVPASAAGLTQSQISAIIALLQSFGAEQSVINNVSVSLGGGTPGNSGSGISCIELSYNLFSGSTDNIAGGQVTKLQRFLGVSQTGYFGPATEAAVQRWQAQNGIVSSGSPDSTGYGYVGAKTRAAMARGCNGSTASDVIFGATPTYGTAPLFVKFSTNQKSGVIYYDKGAFMASCLPDEAERGGCDFSLGHGWTYKTPGTYTATLTTACPTNKPNCSTRVLGTKIITVTGQTTNTPSATVDTPVVTPITGSNRFDVALTGSALNFGGANKGNQLYNWTDIVVVPSTYRGSLDLRVIGRMHDETVVEGSSNAEVRNGRWAHSFNLGVGTHKVLVYDYYGDTSAPITTRTITVSGGSTATCPTYNSSTAVPNIRSITPNSGPVGTTITVTGCNFYGFESDTNLWFTNTAGMKGVLYGGANKSNTSISVALPARLCTQDVSYSGLPCPSYMDMIPGTYSVTESGYGVSNAVIFTVTGQTNNTSSATIDNSSLTQSRGNFYVNGSASNATSLQIIMVTGNYTGATDWNSANAAVRANSVYNVNSTARVENGRWVGVFGSGSGGAGVPAGTYTLLVYDLSNDGVTPSVLPKLLTRNVLTVQY